MPGEVTGIGRAAIRVGVAAALCGLFLAPPAARGQCEWRPLVAGVNGQVHTLTVFDDGIRGPELWVGGEFTAAIAATSANRIARWDGATWWKIGAGMDEGVYTIAEFEDPSLGRMIHAGGAFNVAGTSTVESIARAHGTTWLPLLVGLTGTDAKALSMAVYDDGAGGGPALYVGGVFNATGSGRANNIARWDGSGWSELGSGTTGSVNALAVFDDGSGPALYAGGGFGFAGGVSTSGVAKWDGSAWAAVGGGVNHYVHALIVHDDGAGPALYAAGEFTVAGGVAANHIAKWDGAAWSPVGDGTDGGIYALASFDDGSGPALFVGGAFATAGAASASSIARWDGAAWSALGSGFNGEVRALAVFDDHSGSGPALHAGGTFVFAGEVVVNHIAKWHCEPAPCYADCDGSGTLDFFDFLCFQNAFAAGCK